MFSKFFTGSVAALALIFATPSVAWHGEGVVYTVGSSDSGESFNFYGSDGNLRLFPAYDVSCTGSRVVSRFPDLYKVLVADPNDLVQFQSYPCDGRYIVVCIDTDEHAINFNPQVCVTGYMLSR